MVKTLKKHPYYRKFIIENYRFVSFDFVKKISKTCLMSILNRLTFLKKLKKKLTFFGKFSY